MTDLGNHMTTALPRRRFPGHFDAMSWLLDYGDALGSVYGEAWQAFAEAHVRSGRTDGTSWQKWRDECKAATP